MDADYRRARVIYPGGIVSPGRFVVKDGTVAVWTEDNPRTSATRVLYATGVTFEPSRKGRVSKLIVSETETWDVIQLSGGCCGGGNKGLLAGLPVEQLIDPDITHIG